MIEINSVTNQANNTAPQVTRINDATNQQQTLGNSTVDGEVDSAEFSDVGQLMGVAHETADVRADKVAAVKLAIEQDVDTFIEERLDLTVDLLSNEIFGQ